MHVTRKGPAGLAGMTRIRVRMKQLTHLSQYIESFAHYPEVKDIECQRERKEIKNIGRGWDFFFLVFCGGAEVHVIDLVGQEILSKHYYY